MTEADAIGSRGFLWTPSAGTFPSRRFARTVARVLDETTDHVDAQLSTRSVARAHDWQPILNCAGRYTLGSKPSAVSPAQLVGSMARPLELRSVACRDVIEFIRFSDGGGLLSYRRVCGDYVHTLNTPSGLRRKLMDLGLGEYADP